MLKYKVEFKHRNTSSSGIGFLKLYPEFHEDSFQDEVVTYFHLMNSTLDAEKRHFRDHFPVPYAKGVFTVDDWVDTFPQVVPPRTGVNFPLFAEAKVWHCILMSFVENGEEFTSQNVTPALAVEALGGLQILHDAGVLHEDIRKENILISGNRVIWVDFGLSTIESAAERRLQEMQQAVYLLFDDLVSLFNAFLI
jgi:serine/threonine protein kinase